MSVRIHISKSMTCHPTELTVADLRAFLSDEPGDAKVSVKTEWGDRPGELGQTHITIEGDLR